MVLVLRIMVEICPHCKKDGALNKMSGCTTAGRRRRTSKKWIQQVVRNMKKGAFIKQALRHGETPEEYAEDVLSHPGKHTLKTRRRAQFLRNIRKTSKLMYMTGKLARATRKSRR